MSKTLELLQNINDPVARKEIVESILLSKLDEAITVEKDVEKLPDHIPTDIKEAQLEKIHVSPRKNPQGNVIMWDPKEGKYYNQSGDSYLSTKELKQYGLMEHFYDEINQDLVAEATLDIMDAIQCGRVNEAQLLIAGIMETRLIEMAEYPSEDDPNAIWVEYDEEDDPTGEYDDDDEDEYDDDDEDEYDDDDEDDILEAKIITKVNSLGVKRRRLQCRPGYQLSNGVCVPVSGSKKVTKLRSAKKAARTKRSMGSGYAMKVAKKTKKAMVKRKAFGLREHYLNEAADTRGSISHVLGKMGFGGVQVPQAQYNSEQEIWLLKVQMTPSEMKHLQAELTKVDKRRFASVKSKMSGDKVELSVPLHESDSHLLHYRGSKLEMYGKDLGDFEIRGLSFIINKEGKFWTVDMKLGYGQDFKNKTIEKRYTTLGDVGGRVALKDAKFETVYDAANALGMLASY